MVSWRLRAVLASIVLLTACRNDLKNKEKVQAAILDRLQHRTGLDLNSLNVTTTDVTFERNKARATVAFHSKTDTAIDSGMTMQYTLEQRDGKWVVTNVGDSQGHSMLPQSAAGGAVLPPGHPPVDGAASSNPHAATGASR